MIVQINLKSDQQLSQDIQAMIAAYGIEPRTPPPSNRHHRFYARWNHEKITDKGKVKTQKVEGLRVH